MTPGAILRFFSHAGNSSDLSASRILDLACSREYRFSPSSEAVASRKMGGVPAGARLCPRPLGRGNRSSLRGASGRPWARGANELPDGRPELALRVVGVDGFLPYGLSLGRWRPVCRRSARGRYGMYILMRSVVDAREEMVPRPK